LLRDGLPLVVLVVWWSAIVAYATLLTTVEEADGAAVATV
jgi:hypothetical protein